MTEHRPDDDEKVVNLGGRPVALTPQHILLLREIVTRMPHATLDELAAELDHLGEVRVCAATIRRMLRAHGIVRSMPVWRAGGKLFDSVESVAPPKRYRYTAAHGVMLASTGRCCINLSELELPLTPDGVTPRAPSAACPAG